MRCTVGLVWHRRRGFLRLECVWERRPETPLIRAQCRTVRGADTKPAQIHLQRRGALSAESLKGLVIAVLFILIYSRRLLFISFHGLTWHDFYDLLLSLPVMPVLSTSCDGCQFLLPASCRCFIWAFFPVMNPGSGTLEHSHTELERDRRSLSVCEQVSKYSQFIWCHCAGAVSGAS